jgi:Phage-related minor tail protein
MNASMTTEWDFKMHDYVSGSLKKLQGFIGGTEDKLNSLDKSFKNSADAGARVGRDFTKTFSQLENQLHRLERGAKNSDNIRHMDKYRQMIAKTKDEMEKLNAAMNPKAAFFSKAGLMSAASEVPMLNSAVMMATNPYVLAGTAVLAVGAGLKMAGDNAMFYDTGMAKINATAQLTDTELSKLKETLLTMGGDSGGNFERVPESFEKILSITGSVDMSLDVLQSSIKGAKAGFADLDIVADSMARTMSALGDKSPAAQELLDTFMMAKNVGAGEFKDFAQYMPSLIAGAGAVGYMHKDAVALYGTLTKTFDPASAAMYAQNVLTAFKRVDIIDALKQGDKSKGIAGIDLFDGNGMRRGLKDVLMDMAKLQETMSAEEWTRYLDKVGLKDAQASTGIAALTGNVKNLITVFDGLGKSIGEADRQMDATNSSMRTWDKLADKVKEKSVFWGDMWNGAKDAMAGAALWVLDLDKHIESLMGRIPDFYAMLFKDKPLERSLADRTKDLGLDTKKNPILQLDKNGNMPVQVIAPIDFSGKGKETAATKALNNVNSGKSAGDTSTTTLADKTLSTTATGGGGARSIVMHLEVNNTFSDDNGVNVEKIKKIITDIIVDSARDAMVVVGT